MGKKTLYLVGDNQLDYVAEVGETKINLNYSNGDQWTSHTKGTRIGSVKDDGNGIRVKIGDIDTYLDYSSFCNLYTLLDLKVKTETNLMTELEYLSKYEKDKT
jgi:hypothetical protein|tara:strand:- start:3818 stop:4126 length:309 start_codon:yes stop_codon:yes gene_type:complete